MIQVFSIAFQLSGGILLLLWSVHSASKKRIIEKCFPGSNIVERDKNDNCIVSRKRLQDAASEVYLNIAAIIDLLIGYFLAFLPSNNYTACKAAAYTAFLFCAIMALEKGIVCLLTWCIYKDDARIAYETLKDIGVDTIMTAEEVDKICSVGDPTCPTSPS